MGIDGSAAGRNGFPNMVWYSFNGLPGSAPPPANPAIPIPDGAWTSEGGQWWTDAVQATGQPGIYFLLTTGYEAAIRAFRTSGGIFTPCGSYLLNSVTESYGGVRVSPSGSFALVVEGSNPSTGQGTNALLSFPLNLEASGTAIGGTSCILGAPTQIPVSSNTAITNVDFNPNNKSEVAISGYSNIVTFMDPISGVDLCDVPLVNGSQSLTRLEARYRPDGTEVWAASYDGAQIAVIAPPPDCAVKLFITQGVGSYGLYGASFHPTLGAYYVVNYTAGHGSNQLFALDTASYSVTGTIALGGAAGMTAVTQGPLTYLLEVPIYGCCPQFGYTNAYDVSSVVEAQDPGAYLLGTTSTNVNWRQIATLRTVQR